MLGDPWILMRHTSNAERSPYLNPIFTSLACLHNSHPFAISACVRTEDNGYSNVANTTAKLLYCCVYNSLELMNYKEL